MKNFNIAITLFLTAIFACSANAGSDVLAEKSLQSFKEDNFEVYTKVMASADDLYSLMEYAKKIKSPMYPAALFEKMTGDEVKEFCANSAKDLHKRGKDNWLATKEEGVKKGIDWKKVTLISHKFAKKPSTVLKSGKLKEANIIVNFSSNNNSYSYELDDCISLPNDSWVCEKIISLKKN
ncbi:MAG: hypothetical protein D6B27_06085 [Gammaproteobacteria bacterium]|nr:MAG: hypothetical protein D6B27_06085 [Gammaproteobacteria bacterium]